MKPISARTLNRIGFYYDEGRPLKDIMQCDVTGDAFIARLAADLLATREREAKALRDLTLVAEALDRLRPGAAPTLELLATAKGER